VSQITTNPAAGSVHILPEVHSLAEPHGAHVANTSTATPAHPEPRSATSSSPTSFVPTGGLHPIADEAHAKRSTYMFLRRVWRDGAV